tara:strand:- start:1170 stop:3380 length:2211 start_codon:yes stop_codon:yes gene_type:complete
MAKQPPKTKRKLNPVARAEIGQMRDCDRCGETKEVTNKHYATFNKGLRGWHTTCRVCQGVEKAEKGAYAEQRTASDFIPESMDDLDDKINEMYMLAETQRNPGKTDKIAMELRELVTSTFEAGHELESFRLFMRVIKPLMGGWKTPGAIHDDIIDGLLSHHRRRLIIATRYSAKSTITSIYVAWRIMLDPLLKVMVVSRGAKLSGRMLRTVRRIYFANCPMLKHLEPTEDCLDNAEQFQTPQSMAVVTGGATLSCFGITSDLPGYRSDLTIGDDVEGPKDDSPEKVGELIEKLNELHMINPTGEKIMLGTYQSEFSSYAQLAYLEDDEGEPVWEHHRACMFEEDEDGKGIRSRWPAMFSDKDGVDWRRSVTARGWRLHAMLIADPSILNERPLKISDLLLVPWDAKAKTFPVSVARGAVEATQVPTWGAPKGDVWYYGEPSDQKADYVQTIASIDPASGLAGRDAIGVAILSILPSGMGVIRHLEGVRGPNKAANMRRCAVILRDFGASHLVVEETAEGFFGETLENELIHLGYPMTVEKVTSGGQKKGQRIIESLAPPMGAGRLVLVESVAYSDHGGDFVTQLVKVSYDGRTGAAKDHDDIVDALAHAVAKCKGSLISDQAELMADFSSQKLEHLRFVPLRNGGLGGSDQGGRNIRGGSGLHGIPSPGMEGESLSMGELLIEEDEVLTKMTARRDSLQHVVRDDVTHGRQVDQQMVAKVKSMTAQIKELKEHQCL